MPILPNNALSSIINLANRANSDSIVKLPLSNAPFTLDSSGVAGFFGGESAVRAMSTVNFVPNRRWFGWYNSPGSYEVAKQYSKLANSRIFDALFPGDDSDPAKVLMIDGRAGPERTLLYSPTKRAPEPIGHLGSLISRMISQMPVKNSEGSSSRSKHTVGARVTLVKLHRLTHETDKLKLFPSESNTFAIGTILISIGGCIACALVADWFCFASIALGIIANGVACLVIGSGKPYLTHDPPSQRYSPGDVLLVSNMEIIVLVGNRGSVSPLTRGRFLLHFRETPVRDQEQIQEHLVSISVVLLLSQFLAQLLLIPQGKLFGQIMFIGTLVPSWAYHSYLSSLRLDLQTQTLCNMLDIREDSDSDDIERYQFKTWTEAAVFTCLAFREIHPETGVSLPTATNGDSLVVAETRAQAAETRAPATETSAQAAETSAQAAETRAQAAETRAQAAEMRAQAAEMRAQAAETAAQAVALVMKWMAVNTANQKLAKARKEENKEQATEKARYAMQQKEAFQTLIDTLLPGKTDVWQAFKDSLASKLGATLDGEDQINLNSADGPGSFNFKYPTDFFATVQDANGKFRRVVRDADKIQLEKYHVEADNALVAWKRVRTIAEWFKNHD